MFSGNRLSGGRILFDHSARSASESRIVELRWARLTIFWQGEMIVASFTPLSPVDLS